MTGSELPTTPDNMAARVAILFRELGALLDDCERERDRFVSDVARIPPYSPNLKLTVTALQLVDRCAAMRRTLHALEGDVRHPAMRHIAMNNPPGSTIHWQVIGAARAQMAAEPGGRRLTVPPTWGEKVADLRALIQQARQASPLRTAWAPPP